jgi:hypothetical protein
MFTENCFEDIDGFVSYTIKYNTCPSYEKLVKGSSSIGFFFFLVAETLQIFIVPGP